MRNRLDAITLKGFKTIRELKNFKPRPLTVLIGPNGAGKSNFISFFRMLSWMLSDPNHLQLYVSQQGGASTLLHDGPDETQEIETALTLDTGDGENQYAFRLFYVAGDTLIFADEKYRFSRKSYSTTAPWQKTGTGHQAPKLLDHASQNTTARVIRDLLQKIVVYQFHNTSDTARIRRKWSTYDNRWLKEDAANIAPFLLRLKEDENMCYQRIINTIRLIPAIFFRLCVAATPRTSAPELARAEQRPGVQCIASVRWHAAGHCTRYPSSSAGTRFARRFGPRRTRIRITPLCH